MSEAEPGTRDWVSQARALYGPCYRGGTPSLNCDCDSCTDTARVIYMLRAAHATGVTEGLEDAAVVCDDFAEELDAQSPEDIDEFSLDDEELESYVRFSVAVELAEAIRSQKDEWSAG